MRDVALLEVEEWFAGLLTKMAPATAKRVLWTAGALERFARRHGHTARAVFADVMSEKRRIAKERIRTFTPEEIKRLLATAQERLPGMRRESLDRVRLFIHVATFCGLRFGEIAALTAEHVDLEQCCIRVRPSVDLLGAVKGPKTRAGIRDVPMPPHVRDMLGSWIERHYVPNDRELLFTTPYSGQAFRGSHFTHVWHAILRRADLFDDADPFHFHALRHFAASWMIQNGLPMPDVAAMLGHATYDMTLQTYAHPIVTLEKRGEVVRQMAARINADAGTLMPT